MTGLSQTLWRNFKSCHDSAEREFTALWNSGGIEWTDRESYVNRYIDQHYAPRAKQLIQAHKSKRGGSPQ